MKANTGSADVTTSPPLEVREANSQFWLKQQQQQSYKKKQHPSKNVSVYVCVYLQYKKCVSFTVQAQDTVCSMAMATPNVQLKSVDKTVARHFCSKSFRNTKQRKASRKCYGTLQLNKLVRSYSVNQWLSCCSTIKTQITGVAPQWINISAMCDVVATKP